MPRNYPPAKCKKVMHKANKDPESLFIVECGNSTGFHGVNKSDKWDEVTCIRCLAKYKKIMTALKGERAIQ